MSVASVHSVGRHLCGVLQDAPWESPISDRCRHLMEQLIKDQVVFFLSSQHIMSSSHLFCVFFSVHFLWQEKIRPIFAGCSISMISRTNIGKFSDS